MKFPWERFAAFILFFAAGLLGAAALSIFTQNVLGLRPQSSAFIWILLPLCTGVCGFFRRPGRHDESPGE